MSAALEELAAHIEIKRPNDVVATEVAFGELNVTATLAGIVQFVEFRCADQNCRFSTLVDITAVDHPERPARFDIVYHFLADVQKPPHPREGRRARGRDGALDHRGPPLGQLVFEREVFDMLASSFPATLTCAAS